MRRHPRRPPRASGGKILSVEGSGLTDLVRRSMEKLWPRPRPAVESRGILAHVPVKGAPRAGLISQPATDHDARIPMARRLIEAYARARADAATARMAVPEDDLWTRLIQAELGPLLHILKSEDAEALSTYLLHFGEQYTWFGGLTLSVDGFTPQVPASSIAVSYLDKLVCLAESEGVLPLENPEQSKHFGENLYVDPDELLFAERKAEAWISVGGSQSLWAVMAPPPERSWGSPRRPICSSESGR
jgi:hypothetical protein